MSQIDFENERGVRLKKGEVSTDATNLQQLLDLKDELVKRVNELTKYILEIGGINPLTIQLIAGENLAQFNFCYLKNDGKMWKTNATDDTKSTTLLAIATNVITADLLGRFYLYGRVNIAGLTMGGIYYLSLSDGGYSITPPSVSGNIVRVVGHAITSEIFFFNPDPTWVKIK